MASNQVASVAIVGVGLVGKQVIRQLSSPTLSKIFRIDSLSNSKYTLSITPSSSFKREPEALIQALPPSSASNPNSSSSDVKVQSLSISDVVKQLAEAAKSNPTTPHILVDCTSDDNVVQLYPAALSSGLHIVTPNKKGFSSSESLYTSILSAKASSGTLVYQESTVGAGLPIIGTLKDLIDTGDEVTKIEGVLSGTLSYVFNEFSKPAQGEGSKFSEVIKVAKEKGYTEPNPADDLSGSDVARKLAILARLVSPPSSTSQSKFSLPEGYKSIPTEPLVPTELLNASSIAEFMEKLPSVDAKYDDDRRKAVQNGNVLRYVGSIDVAKGEVKCSLQSYPSTHPFANLGSDNIVAFYTTRYGPRPLIVQGAGAGADVTAMGVVADCIKVAERTLPRSSKF